MTDHAPPGRRHRDRPRTAVVVGAGIGGLAAARALQSVDWSVRVLEQAPVLDPLGAGITLWPNAMHALDRLAVPRPAGSWPTGVSGLRTADGRLLSRTYPQRFPARYGAPLIAVHRSVLHEALLATLRPGTVLAARRVEHVDQRARGALVAHCGGTEAADLVVLADGLNSTTRHLVAGPTPRRRYVGYTAWRGVTDGGDDPPRPGFFGETWGRGHRFGLVPLADGGTYWFATANAAEGQRSSDGEPAEVMRRFAGWHEPIERVVQATAAAAVLRHDVYDLRPDPGRYVTGRLVLLGDAAHAMTPDLGQGACLALEDAATLGALLRRDADVDRALHRYDALRRPRAQAIARRSRTLGRVGQLSGRGATTVRDLLLGAVPDAVMARALDAMLDW